MPVRMSVRMSPHMLKRMHMHADMAGNLAPLSCLSQFYLDTSTLPPGTWYRPVGGYVCTHVIGYA